MSLERLRSCASRRRRWSAGATLRSNASVTPLLPRRSRDEMSRSLTTAAADSARLTEWQTTARALGLVALNKFCDTLERWQDKIANDFVSRSSNGPAEDFNNGLRTILREPSECSTSACESSAVSENLKRKNQHDWRRTETYSTELQSLNSENPPSRKCRLKHHWQQRRKPQNVPSHQTFSTGRPASSYSFLPNSHHRRRVLDTSRICKRADLR